MSRVPVNKSEAFVLQVSQRSFLSLWCYNNPRGKEPGKELCDILVVCHPHVIIISVKEVALKETGNPSLDFERWERRAVEASIKQIHGAERWLDSATQVIRSDGTPGLLLPPKSERRVHRVAVALGGREQVPIGSGDSGKGFVHVMDERSFYEVLTELDTITDLVDYLSATEALAARGCAVVINGSESNLLGWYLFNGRSFPTGSDLMIVGDDIWEKLQSKPEFGRRKEADQASYYWDRLIELLAGPNAKPSLEAGPALSQWELGLRAMARESRFSRRMLGDGIRDFFEQAKAGKLRSRVLRGVSGTIYVFAYFIGGEDDELRQGELLCRCFIARHQTGSGDTVVGAGITKYVPGVGSGSDLVYMHVPQWSEAEDRKAAAMQADLGYFKGRKTRKVSVDEYPA